jgi:ATP-dependent Lhr-like helicase
MEAFDKYVIIHACFGEVVNRSFGCIFDSVLSDKELITGWWNDGYRILIEMLGETELKDLEKIRSILFGLTDEEISQAFEDYLKARFPFSYKMKFVAERFGALPRGRTMGPERLAELPRRFRKTPIYDETVREVMLEKVDLTSVKKIMKKVKKGKIKIKSMLCLESPTPLAYHILKKYSDVPELMTPERLLLSNIERMKRAILARKATLFCLSCGEWSAEERIRELPENPVCGECGAGLLACLRFGQKPKKLRDVLKHRLKGEELVEEDLKQLSHARRTADLILSYGKKALIALQVRGVGPETAFRILGKMHPKEDDFYMDLLKAKIQYLRTRPYWEDDTKNVTLR